MQTYTRRAVLAAACLIGLGSLAACSEPAAEPTTSSSADSATSTTLTLYTSEPEAKVDAINAAFTAANPDITIEVYRAGTGDLTARLESEKASGTIGADLLWAADAATFEKYATAGDLSSLKDIDTSALLDEVVDPNGFYVGTRIIPTVIAVNTTAVQNPPQSWLDLTSPEWADKIVMPDPAVSGAAAYNATVWANTPGLGQQWFDQLGANRPQIAASNGPTSQDVASGARPVGVVVDYLVRDLAAKGSPISAVYPTDGVPYITEPVGIFEVSDAKDAARRYIEFLLSPEGQRLAVEQNYLPVRGDVGTPDGAPQLADLTLLTVDLPVITAGRADAVAAFTSAIAQR